MKKLILIILVIFTTTSFAQEKSKLNYESGIGVSWEGNYGMVGMNQYNTLLYSLNRSFLLSANLGFFQSLHLAEEFDQNSSAMVCDFNLNYSIVNKEKSNFYIGAGLTYFKGALTYDDGTTFSPRHNADYINTLGVNALLKYRYRLSERWLANIALRTYLQDPSYFQLSFSSITYGFTYCF